MADPNQTPDRGDWACPCSGCQKAVKWERKQLVTIIKQTQKEYLEYRGSSFDGAGNLLWAKDDAMTYCEGLDKVIELIESRNPKPKSK
jgi:hypothetical protein